MNPTKRLLELAQMKEDLEQATRYLVAAARRDGASWQAIANVIGGTKQAAQQRYGKLTIADGGTPFTAANLTPAQWELANNRGGKPFTASELEGQTTIEDVQLPAEPSRNVATKAPAKAKKKVGGGPVGWRPKHELPGAVPETAEPGIGAPAPHECPACGHNNHKGADGKYAEFVGYCIPTRYDPQHLADFINATNAHNR